MDVEYSALFPSQELMYLTNPDHQIIMSFSMIQGREEALVKATFADTKAQFS